MLTSWTVNTSTALAGMSGGEPAAPYASDGGMMSCRVPPTFIPTMPYSQPAITRPDAAVMANGCDGDALKSNR